jgi:hypothetical protein
MPLVFIAWLIVKKFILTVCIFFKNFMWANVVGRRVFVEDFKEEYRIY